MFEAQRTRLLNNLEVAHAAYYRAALFGGPSLYFHLRALEAARVRDLPQFVETSYAMLASWGMHRMGRGGSKMREFGEFSASVTAVWPLILKLQTGHPGDLTDHQWADLAAVFFGIRAMATGTSLVGTSKVMAHALPQLVAPVDREYTLTLLFGSGQLRNDIHAEWSKLRQILEHFFYPISASPSFVAKAEAWTRQSATYKWDTSFLRIIDNLLIGLQKTPAERHDEPAGGSAVGRRRGLS